MRDDFSPAEPGFDEVAGASDGHLQRSYVNPILDHDFPDPAILRAPDGFYYAYATQTQRGDEWINIQLARSPDLIHWENLGDALPEKPDWARTTQDFWAPSVIYDGSTYFMYYSRPPMPAITMRADMRSPSRPPTLRRARSSTWACRCCSAWGSNISTRMPSTAP